MHDYLMSRAGRPLHLAVYAYDRPSKESYQTGRYVPLCAQDRGRRWQWTGPWAEKWNAHRRGGLCSRCLSKLAVLTEAAEVHHG